MKRTASLSAALLSLSLSAAVPLRWTVETSRVQPATFDAYQGETLTFEAALQSYGKPLAAPAEYAVYWQTNGMGNAWWSRPCVTTAPSPSAPTNVLFATWSPDMDVGAKVYSCFVGLSNSIYRAAFQLRLRPSPGALPNALPLPTPVIDFSKVTVLNPPWSGGGSGGVDTNAVIDVVRKTVDGSARLLPKYLHALDFADSYPDAAAEYYLSRGDGRTDGGCSAVRDGGFLYRNFDFPFDERAEFVVKMGAGPNRFASVGVAQVGTNLTEQIVTSGKPSRWYKSLPGATVDGINEHGVVCEVNVVDGEPQWRSGVLTASDVHPLAAVRWALDNGTTAVMVASNLAARIKFPVGWAQNFHWMVADESSTYIVENGAYSNVTGRAVMTNFPLINRVDGMGLERYNLLVGGESITNAWFTRAYSRSTNWISEFKDPAEMEEAKSAWETHTRDQLRGHGLWQSVHTSVYNLTNRTLSVAVQEVDDWYTFAVPSAGGVKPEAVKEIVGPMIGDATNDLGKAKRDKTDLDVYQIGVVPEGPWTWTSSDERLAAALTRDGVVPTFGRFYGEDDVWAPVPDVGDDWSGDGPVFYVPSDEESVSMYFTRSWAPGEPAIVATATRHPVEKSVGKLSHVKESGGALPTGVAKLGAGGELEAAKKSSEYGADADYRDPKDNVCHETNFSKWTFGGDVKAGSSYRIIENEGSPERPGEYFYYLTEDGTDVWSDGFYEKQQTDLEMPTYDGKRTITATRSAVCTSNETFVTRTFVTNEVATAIAADNPAFSNAVLAVGVDTNVLAAVSGLDTNVVAQIGDFYATFADIGVTPTQGGMTLAGLLAALVAAVTWLKKKALVGGLTGGIPDDQKLRDFFAESNSYSGELPTPTGKLKNSKLDQAVQIVLAEKGGGGGSQGYAFVDLTPTTESGYKVFAAQDHAINRFTLADATPVKVILPNATDENGRDFILKVNVTSETMPTFEIVKPSDAASIGIEAADDGWADLEAGINYFTITETDRA